MFSYFSVNCFAFNMKVFIVLLVCPIVTCDWSLVGNEPKEVYYFFKRTECKHSNPKFIANITCNTVLLNHTFKNIKIEINIRPGIKLDKVFIELTTYKKFGTVYRPTLIKLKENFCDIVGNKTDSYLARQFRKIYDTSISNFLEPCPLTGRKYLLGKKYSKDNEGKNVYAGGSLPPLMPIGDWKFIYQLSTLMNGPEELVVQFTDVYEVAQKSALQF